MQNEQRFDEIITQVMALAAEAEIRGNDPYPGLGYWKTLAHNLYQAAVTTAGDRITKRQCLEADERAIRQIAYAEPVEVKEMVEP